MSGRDRAGAFVKAMGNAVPWLLLLVVGLALQAIPGTQKTPLPSDVQVLIVTIGGAIALIGSFGVGARIGREQTNEALRIKLETAFRRTARLYDRLRAVRSDLTNAAGAVEESIEGKGELVPLHVVVKGLDVLAVRLEEQITTYDNALDEWSELVPAEVEKERERLRAGRL